MMSQNELQSVIFFTVSRIEELAIKSWQICECEAYSFDFIYGAKDIGLFLSAEIMITRDQA